MAAHGYRPRSCNTPSEGSQICTPDGVCRFIPNNNNRNHQQQQQQQGFVMKFETSFEHLQPSHNHGLVVKEPSKPKPAEEFMTKVQTEASQPPFFPNSQSPPQRFQIPISSAGQEFLKVQTEASQPQPPFFPTSQSPPQRFQIPISSAGHRDNTVFADIKPKKQDRERGPTHGHGHGGWDEPHQPHQLMERSWSNNGNDHKDDYRTKETRPPWTYDTRWLPVKSSIHDNRLSKPVNNIDEALEVFKGLTTKPQLPDKDTDMKPPPQSNSSPNPREAINIKKITSKEAAEKYNGHLVK